MFRTVFSRLLIIYIGIMLLTVVGQSLLFVSIYRNEAYSDRTDEMEQEALQLAPMAIQTISTIGHTSDGTTSATSDPLFLYAAQMTVRRYNAILWAVDKAGDVMLFNGMQDNVHGGDITAKDVGSDMMSNDEFRKYLLKIMDGQIITEKGTFNGRFSNDMISVGVPVRYNGMVVGALFMHSRVDTVASFMPQLLRQMGLSAIIAFLCGAVLVAWMSSRISHPLVQMNAIAGEIARGNFGRKADVTSADEVGQLANSFNAMAEELQKQEDMRKGFVANVSHELRSPLTSIQGFAQGMMDGTIDDSDHQRYLGIIVDETRRLNKLIRELLDLAQIESGNFPLKKMNFEINERVRLALIRFEERIESKNLQVEADFHQDKAVVYADPDRIDQVINNLIDNAVKFSPQGGTLTVWSHAAEDKILVGISDEGPGIPEEDQKYVWERFYKVDKAHTAGNGTGLGLSIVKRIIDQHGERITMQSKLGAGTTFVISLTIGK